MPSSMPTSERTVRPPPAPRRCRTDSTVMVIHGSDPIIGVLGDPAADSSDPLEETRVATRQLLEGLDDPIPLTIAGIHDEIERLLLLHRSVYDGIELAADQVQDKQIEFLQQGP